MNKDFILPDIGEGIVECEILEWKVKEGDIIEEDQVIADVSTDKAIVEIPSMFAGRITKLHYAEGATAKVHSPLFSIQTNDIETPSVINQTDEVETPSAINVEELSTDSLTTLSPDQKKPVIAEKVLTTPAVRQLARQHDLDLSLIKGSGKHGRILKEDIQLFLTLSGHVGPVQEQHSNITNNEDKGVVQEIPKMGSHDKDMTKVQKLMALKMVDSVTSIPHFTFVDEIDVTDIVKVRLAFKSHYAEDKKITLMPFLIKSLSLTLRDFPILNSCLHENGRQITYFKNHNIGVAVDGKTGLLVPNIKSVECLSIIQVAEQLALLTGAARSGLVKPADLSGGTITVSNIGAIGGIAATPIINKPEVAIVALGKIQKLPRFNISGQIEERQIMSVSWSGDHRVIDGATMARFNNLWKDYLENPMRMLATMA
ncbi:MAG: 2-oxo acid dehydrogenase subunit E2 [Porticoccaceae bacterium]|nr:2-oxo acid dehydrogenase subunit E2 [Porticoccaceae bacterium]